MLRPAGRGVFFENHALNPLLGPLAAGTSSAASGCVASARRTSIRSPAATMRSGASRFPKLELEYPDFHFFALLGRQLFTERRRVRESARRLDDLVWRRLPAARPYGYHVLVKVTR